MHTCTVGRLRGARGPLSYKRSSVATPSGQRIRRERISGRGSIIKRFAAAGAGLGSGAHIGATDGTVQNQFHAASRAGSVLFADGRATLGTKCLVACSTAPLSQVHLRVTARAAMTEIEATFGAMVHFRLQIGATARAAKRQFGPTSLAGGVILPHGCAADRTQRLSATRALGQPQPHIGATGRAGPGRVKPTVGAGNLIILQQ